MHDINIYFIGGSCTELKECTDEATTNVVNWLDGNENETFKIDIPTTNKTICFRKENILFIEVI